MKKYIIRAANIAKSIKKTDWEQVDGCVDNIFSISNEDLDHISSRLKSIIPRRLMNLIR